MVSSVQHTCIWFHPLQGFLIIAFLEEDYEIEKTRTIIDRFGELLYAYSVGYTGIHKSTAKYKCYLYKTV